MDYESWARSEITRLRTEAQKALAEADGIEKMLNRWYQAQKITPSREPSINGNGGAKRIIRKKIGRGGKTAFVMRKIEESASAGITTDDIFAASERDGIGIKRSSLRSMLWHAKDHGDIELRNGKYFKTQKGPSA